MSEVASSEPAPRLSLGLRAATLAWALALAAIVAIAGAIVAIGMGVIGGGLYGMLHPDLSLSDARNSDLASSPLYMLFAALTVVSTYSVLVRLVERRDRVELAPQGAWVELAIGCGLAATAFGLLMAVLTVIGAVQWRPPPLEDWRLVTPDRLATGIGVGVAMAVLVQGVLTRLLAKALGPIAAVVIVALLVAFWFPAPDSPPLPAQRLGALLGGAILALVYLRTQRLWQGMGLAATWSALALLTIGGYHLEGGYDTTAAFIFEPERGPLISWLRGPDGPESSVLLLVGWALVVAWLVRRAWKEGRLSRA